MFIMFLWEIPPTCEVEWEENYKICKDYDDKTKEKCEKDYLEVEIVCTV